MTADQLDALVAPIALYPDALVAQVLGAAAAPDQVSAAALWLAQNNSLTGTALAQAVNQQTWDPSIKALTQFPDVLNNLAGNLGWTSELGQAFQNQQSDVMAAVQVMRAKAQAAGTLQSTPQIKVVQQSPQTIVIQPADPDVVYVPQYNPTVVYGTPYVVPLYTPQCSSRGSRCFLWSGYKDRRGIRRRWLCRWGRLCRRRFRMGLALVELQLGRWWWRQCCLSAQHLHSQHDLHQQSHDLQQLSPLGAWSPRTRTLRTAPLQPERISA
jgi:hypothetical protein